MEEKRAFLNAVFGAMEAVDGVKKVDNINIQVLFIDNESEDKLFISDFRKLGNEWRLYKGDKYIRCADCNILVKKKKGTTKYCLNCKKENNLIKYKKYNKKRK